MGVKTLSLHFWKWKNGYWCLSQKPDPELEKVGQETDIW
jgi:hypothetical protein